MGFLLSKEEGYNQQALWWHKWGGVAVSLFSFGWYAYRNTIHRTKYMPQLAALVSFILIVFTGHQGSDITHGEKYLLAPITPEKVKPKVPLEEAVCIRGYGMAILETKCMSCHSSKKAKGELIMETDALLLKGGKARCNMDTRAAGSKPADTTYTFTRRRKKNTCRHWANHSWMKMKRLFYFNG